MYRKVGLLIVAIGVGFSFFNNHDVRVAEIAPSIQRTYNEDSLLAPVRATVRRFTSQDALPEATSASGLITREFADFTVVIDCQHKGAVLFQYTLTADTGSFEREENFSHDPRIPADCQQSSTDTYRAPGQRYDRGHLVPANHMDHDRQAIRQSNMMTNILPQAANMNRGAWYRTEQITECYRDIAPVQVTGGVVWGTDESDDHFVKTHGIATPDAYWKVISQQGNQIAWLIPNSQDARSSSLDRYIVTIEQLQRVVGYSLPVEATNLSDRPLRSWAIPGGCDFG